MSFLFFPSAIRRFFRGSVLWWHARSLARDRSLDSDRTRTLHRSEVEVRGSGGYDRMPKLVRGFARARMTRANDPCKPSFWVPSAEQIMLFKRMGNQQLHSVHRSKIMPLLRKGLGVVFVCKTARFSAHMRFEQDQNWRFIFFCLDVPLWSYEPLPEDACSSWIKQTHFDEPYSTFSIDNS